MNPANVSLFNAMVLIGVGAYGYLTSGSPTALIPAGLGLVIAALNPWLRKNNKVVAHVAVAVTLLILLMLGVPLKSALSDGRTGSAIRVGVMMLATLAALVVFVKSFVDVRKARRDAGQP